MKPARLLIALVLASAGVASAQSMPPVRQSKEAAERAVAATNRHTAAMTADSTSQGAPAGAQRDSARRDSAGVETQSSSGSVSSPVASFEREVYRYRRDGRRDPFMSLMASGDLRPVITDLRVSTIVYDPRGNTSVAILRDISTKEQYRVKVGQTIGRIRVARIDAKSVTFTIEEFGFSRQETLALGDPNKESSQ